MRALLSLYTVCVLSLNNGVGRTPAMGFSTWNTFGPDVSDSLIRETADAMASNGLLEAGYEYLNLDDGWCVGRDNETGVPIPDPKLFPFGMKPMIDYVHSKGLKFGIYTARGSLTCCGRPGSDMHEVIDAQTYAAWGVDYLKGAFLSTYNIMGRSYGAPAPRVCADPPPPHFFRGFLRRTHDWNYVGTVRENA